MYYNIIYKVKGDKIMKRKILNLFITLLAVVGVFVVIGAVGTMDYMVDIGRHYSLFNTARTMIVGIVMCLPAIIRQVI